MSKITTNRNLLVIIGILVLTNIAILGYFLWLRQPKKAVEKERVSITEQLEKEAGFTKDQIATYKAMKEAQKKAIHPMFEDMRKAKEDLFQRLGDNSADSATLERLTDTIAARQKRIDLQTINYFREARKICTPEQQPKYDSIVIRAFRKMGRGPHSDNKK